MTELGVFQMYHDAARYQFTMWRKTVHAALFSFISLRWRHIERDGVSNHQPHDCLLKHLFRRKSKETSKLRVIGLCVGNSPATGEFPAQRASNAENVSIWWRHHVSHEHRNNISSLFYCKVTSYMPWLFLLGSLTTKSNNYKKFGQFPAHIPVKRRLKIFH